jgi:hypothetical protein
MRKAHTLCWPAGSGLCRLVDTGMSEVQAAQEPGRTQATAGHATHGNWKSVRHQQQYLASFQSTATRNERAHCYAMRWVHIVCCLQACRCCVGLSQTNMTSSGVSRAVSLQRPGPLLVCWQ